MKDFTIDQVSWHTQQPRNYEFDSSIVYAYFKSIISYLQQNNLTTRVILADDEEVTEETKIQVSDLTEEGFLLIKAAYEKWITKVDNRKIAVDDFKMLNKALDKIRNPKQE
ncbi:hypothetical protein [Chitinophaga sp. CB10]|uniref:hypothetical protein n=1 Tax=Chitinophaga sp. CB10 TaxID=1891659 RepID=UPI0025B9D6A1|nr:hypothetical protein [Chitinophaga sp. CB10]